MQFSDTSTKTGLIEHCETTLFGDNGYGQISGNTNRLYQFTNLLNRALDTVSGWIITADGKWQWDDTNNTEYPIATTDLITNQQDYTFALEHLKIDRVEIKDQNGNWTLLKPIDRTEIGIALGELFKNPGIPTNYDKNANGIFLYPKPNFDSTAGLKIYFQRGPSYFVYTDTTKVPGIASTKHPTLYKIACLEYALDKGMPISVSLASQVKSSEDEIKEFYSDRNKDEGKQIRGVIRPSK